MNLGQPMQILPNNSVFTTSMATTPSPSFSQSASVIMQHHHQPVHQYQMHLQQPQSLLGKRPIAPAPQHVQNMSSSSSSASSSASSTSSIDAGDKRSKKMTYTHMPYTTSGQPPSVARRNARERNRVKQVNNGFTNLRQHIPQPVIAALTNGGRGASKKLSKVDTLKMAVEYIRRLQDMLDDNEYSEGNSSNSSSTSTVSDGSHTSTSSYYLGSPHEQQIQQPLYSEASASPTPSFESESSLGNSYVAEPATFKCESYENYNPMSEDEELLDAITWWQQQ